MVVTPFVLLFVALGVLLLGEALVRRTALLQRSNIPPAIIGGFLAALAILLLSRAAPGALTVQGSTDNAAWLWLIQPQWGLGGTRPTDVERPLLILFFTCVGLNASWAVARRGGAALAVYLAIAALVAVLQATTGAGVASLLGEEPLLGVLTSNVALMGGFGTAAGFASEFEKAGIEGAATLGIAAAAFGVISGGLIGGLVGGLLVERKLGLKPHAGVADGAGAGTPVGFLAEAGHLLRAPGPLLVHLATLALCVKLGAFVSLWIQSAGITFPVYMGAMLVASLVRNAHDLAGGRWLQTERVDAIGSVVLMWLLAVVMIDLQLAELASAAPSLLVLLTVQVLLMAAVAWWLVFPAMGRDYEAAALSTGMIGFGLGAVSNAVATMRVLVQRFGPAPKAWLIVPIVGAFLIDFLNALLSTLALNLLR